MSDKVETMSDEMAERLDKMGERHHAVCFDQHGVETDWMDKDDWGDGPWQYEPDRLQWVDETTGLVCLTLRHEVSGHWCGYVGVPTSSNWHGKTGNDELDVHGGATYASPCQKDERPIDERVCHTPAPGQPDDLWWIGFDCAHAGDRRPRAESTMDSLGLPSGPFPYESYKDLDYVIGQVANLARQVAA